MRKIRLPSPQINRLQRDAQRSRVYAWEALASGKTCQADQLISTQACEQFARQVWQQEARRFGLSLKSLPSFIEPRAAQKFAWSVVGQTISLPAWARNHWVVLHELAHHLCPSIENEGSHGPAFVGCLIGLLGRHAGYDAADLVHSANRYGVRVSHDYIGPALEVGMEVRLH